MGDYLPAHRHTAACGHIEAPAQPPACTHTHSPQPSNSGVVAKWVAIGTVGSLFLVAFSLSAVTLTICVLVLYAIWKDVRGDKG